MIVCPSVVLLLAFFLLCFTRTRKVFRMDVWEWWKKKFAHEEEDLDAVSELSYGETTSSEEKKDLGSENYGLDLPWSFWIELNNQWSLSRLLDSFIRLERIIIS